MQYQNPRPQRSVASAARVPIMLANTMTNSAQARRSRMIRNRTQVALAATNACLQARAIAEKNAARMIQRRVGARAIVRMAITEKNTPAWSERK